MASRAYSKDREHGHKYEFCAAGRVPVDDDLQSEVRPGDPTDAPTAVAPEKLGVPVCAARAGAVEGELRQAAKGMSESADLWGWSAMSWAKHWQQRIGVTID